MVFDHSVRLCPLFQTARVLLYFRRSTPIPRRRRVTRNRPKVQRKKPRHYYSRYGSSRSFNTDDEDVSQDQQQQSINDSSKQKNNQQPKNPDADEIRKDSPKDHSDIYTTGYINESLPQIKREEKTPEKSNTNNNQKRRCKYSQDQNC